MTQPAQAQGQNVQPVRDALEALRTGQGSFEDVRSAVQAARFAVRPTARTEEDLAANWDYIPLPDSFTDTVVAARWQKVLTPEQVGELRSMAQFVGDEPSRLDQQDSTEPEKKAS